MKQQAFFENAILLTGKLKIIPLIYGSLGLEYITGESLNADDIDILIPGVFVNERWNEFKSILLDEGYALFDEHEHTFQKNGICYSYASIEELESFAGLSLSEFKEHNKDGIRFRIDEVKTVADYITESNDADGVAKFIEKLLLYN